MMLLFMSDTVLKGSQQADDQSPASMDLVVILPTLSSPFTAYD